MLLDCGRPPFGTIGGPTEVKFRLRSIQPISRRNRFFPQKSRTGGVRGPALHLSLRENIIDNKIRISRRTLLGAGFTPAMLLEAGDPWRDKSPSEWTDADLVRMLNNSPWAQPVDIVFGSPEFSIVGSGPEGFIDRGPKRPGIPFVVRWLSAPPYQEAYARATYGQGEEALKQAKEYPGRTEPHYLIGVICPPKLSPPKQESAVQERMKSESALKRMGMTDIHPESMTTVPGKRQAIVFRFPRTSEITLADKSVEFSTVLYLSWAKIYLRRKFRLEEMIWQGRLAL
jgi:hypothetical protein